MKFVQPGGDEELKRVTGVLDKLKARRLDALACNDPVESIVAIQVLIDAAEAEMQELRKRTGKEG